MNPSGVPRLSVALLSASALAFEILLMKLFSIVQWHHFAYMVISLALLGYGASGTFLSLAREQLLEHFSYAYVANIALFGITGLGSFIIAQHLPFNPLELFLDYKQVLWLFSLYLLLALPFFFAANAIGLAFIRHKGAISGLYGADLLGAGAGSLGILVLLYLFFPESVLKIIAASALLGAAVGWKEVDLRVGTGFFLLLAGALIAALLPRGAVALKMGEYKDLSQALRITGARVVEERSSPLGLLTVVASPEVPFRYAPGLSIAWNVEPPEQLGLFTNGDSMSAITRYEPKRLGYLDFQASALGYHLGNVNRVLVIGAGGGSEVLQALYCNAGDIDAVEINPQTVELVSRHYAAFSGNIYNRENVHMHIAEARGFIASSNEQYDLIQMSMVDSFGASSAGLQSLSENYLYTTEALRLYVEHLRPGGYLCISRWLKLPPRDALKLFATALEALKKSGVKHPQEQLFLIRGLQTTTLVVKNGSFGAEEIARLKRFCDDRYFDTAYYPGMQASEANRYNILAQPLFFEGVRTLLEEGEDFYDRYKFDVIPATDNRPYFYHFFKWKTLLELISLRGSGGLHLLERGYPVLVASLFQAIIASAVLILLPLVRYRSVERNSIATTKSRVLLYFFALGFGFLFLEIYFIQRFVLFLSHPLTTVAVVLSGFLIFAGFGSGYSSRLSKKKGQAAAARYAIAGILFFGLLYMLTLDALFGAFTAQPQALKIAFSFLLIAPLAFAMGIPFPMGLSELAKHSEALVPWAWGVNGCASVISAIFATLLAIHFGFVAVMAAALFFYLLAWVAFPTRRR
jgi:spermidine synthase